MENDVLYQNMIKNVQVVSTLQIINHVKISQCALGIKIHVEIYCIIYN